MENFSDLIIQDLDDNFVDKEYKENWNTYSYNGVRVPRVSNILKLSFDNEGLMRWSNSLGFRRLSYEDTLRMAAERGTACHLAVENYILKGISPDYSIYEDHISSAVYNTFNGFKKWWSRFIKQNKVEVVEIEKTIVCPYFGGTLDILLRVNGELFIYDLKTSSKVQNKHFIQLSAYKWCLEKYYNMKIAGVSVLLLDKNKEVCTEYLLRFSLIENCIFINYCTDLFISMLYSFYNYHRMNFSFKDIIISKK